MYRVLGVTLFRSCVMRLEKLLRRRRGGHNLNYHISGTSAHSVRSFYTYLSYNALLHSVSSVLTVVLFVTYPKDAPHAALFRALMALLLLFNLYCIMLQHCNSIIMKSSEKTLLERQRRRTERLVRSFNEQIDSGAAVKKDDIAIALKVQNVVSGKGACIFTDDDTEALCRLSLLMPQPKNRSTKEISPRTVSQLCKQSASVYEPAEASAAFLQRVFRKPRTVLCIDCPIIVRDKWQSDAFCRLFPDRTPDGLTSTCSALIEAIKRRQTEELS